MLAASLRFNTRTRHTPALFQSSYSAPTKTLSLEQVRSCYCSCSCDCHDCLCSADAQELREAEMFGIRPLGGAKLIDKKAGADIGTLVQHLERKQIMSELFGADTADMLVGAPIVAKVLSCGCWLVL